MVVRIRVAKRIFALIDDEDIERVSQYDWTIRHSGTTRYAVTGSNKIGKSQRMMHRYILGLQQGELADHINGNGLDNRRCNLRRVTAAENARNCFAQKREEPKASRFKGVTRAGGKWVAKINHGGAVDVLGSFDDEQAAARAYDAAAEERFGSFAKTNEMMGLYHGQTPLERSAHVVTGPKVATPISIAEKAWAERGFDPKLTVRQRYLNRLRKEQQRVSR